MSGFYSFLGFIQRTFEERERERERERETANMQVIRVSYVESSQPLVVRRHAV